ncbi:Extradiol aromatic ring-opening dioxygenase [Saitoella complicata NRRL Y-17804]|uniref:Extradiol ring-cleavage dioxygenase class III enzyme subunit B domain-containing protein n=1 Tax=Saitoella complicata (strain BCRC 22490 / CBS 7301 / JCM 7358 / NBRC 10748 / NRRL Y-17804) TaxID=698492 RepID=A0A0E9NN43_SAICN|nr:Extradiol aromatic ring-opening dioxygenase [Saitoella complicata NRRL Y-17804]ODQ51082.1 Extradiol aromatic ring-opening dioxygenase [Saitoella complicata NRRL Y-17804]GAO51254.1 hypothetical protein G7K_5360-t1 [Saitoella complicata NRRL Y-17804]
MNTASHEAQWKASLEALPPYSPGGKIPAFFFAHGSPLLLYPKGLRNPMADAIKVGARDGPHYQFLKYFGKSLVRKYSPKAIVVFSAHWETSKAIEVMDNDSNELYYDYYGFPDEMYKIKFESKGSSDVAQRVVELMNASQIPAKTLPNARGLDHGVFVPFKIMFGESAPVPVVEVSIDSSLSPQRHIKIGQAIEKMRDEGILVLSGGLSIHTFSDFTAWDPEKARAEIKAFEKAIVDAVEESTTTTERNERLKMVTKLPGFRMAHPREEHFIPLYVAAGAGSEGIASVICKLHGALTIAFGA